MIGPFHHRLVSYGLHTANTAKMRHQLIERRAYDKWLAAGAPSGTALQDWLEAESEIDLELSIENNPYCIKRPRLPELVPG